MTILGLDDQGLTTDACKKGNILGMNFQIIDFFYDW